MLGGGCFVTDWNAHTSYCKSQTQLPMIVSNKSCHITSIMAAQRKNPQLASEHAVEVESNLLAQLSTARLRSTTPPEFWDNLSHVPLCARALRELNRRFKCPTLPQSPKQRKRKPPSNQMLKTFSRRGSLNFRNIGRVTNLIQFQASLMTF